MGWNRVVHCLLCFALLSAVLAGIAGHQVVLAQEEPLIEEKLELECKYPILSGESGESFEFEVELKYQGIERRRFDLITSVPPDWIAFVMAGYPQKQIPAIEIGPAEYSVTESLKVQFAPLFWKPPEPGDYVLTLETSSGDLKETIELNVEITARYGFSLDTATGRLNTEITAGEDNHISILLENTGTAAVEDITLSSTKPEGWSITFNPTKVDSLEKGLTQEVDVVIKPPRKTIAGDYRVYLKANSEKGSEDLELRVTVLTPTIWGWVGILIVLAIIAGLAVMFWRLGRR